MLPSYKINIFARACITRYDNGEGGIKVILRSYNLSSEDENLVLAKIASLRPDIPMEA